MLRSLKIGKVDGIDALIETINNKEIILGRIQTKPHYHCEEFAFDFEGNMLGINRIKDISYNEKKVIKSKFGIKINYDEGIIELQHDKRFSKEVVQHAIEEAYLLAGDFYKALEQTEIKNKALKEDLEYVLDKITYFDWAHYLFYEVK